MQPRPDCGEKSYRGAGRLQGRKALILRARRRGRRALVPGDIQHPAHCRALATRVARELGGLDILVNNAGFQRVHSSFLEMLPEEIDRVFASKGAIVAFTQGLSQELAEKGIRVNAVAPGPVWTPLIPASGVDVEHFGKNTPLKRAAQPAEMAPIFVLLASNEASYVTGMVYGATGGNLLL